MYKEAALLMDTERIPEAIEKFKVGLNLFYKVALPPHKDTHIAQESLRTCYADSGNTFVL